MASTPWTSFGNRLFKRGNAFFIRVRIPRDLQDLYAATGRRSEICETLKTRDRREAERRCRRRGAEIDQEFAQRRKARDAASQEPISRRLDLIAQRLYREEVTDQGVAFHDQMMRDPDEAEVALGIAVDPWIEGLEEEAWSRKQNEIVAAVLAAAGSPLGPDHGEMVRALGGWSGGGSTSDDYGSGFTAERLYGAIQAVRYDGLDLSHLYLA